VNLSYSSISTYETCPAKFRFQYEDRVPSGSSPALAFGDSLHQALYRFHDRPVPVAPSLEELWATLDDVWVSDGGGGPYKVKVRPPCFAIMQALPQMLRLGYNQNLAIGTV
jgi:hypothetical protein